MWSQAYASLVLMSGITLAALSSSFGFASASTSVAQNARSTSAKTKKESSKKPVATASQQGRTDRDLEVTRLIREKIVSTQDLSTQARNVKIITENGHVILEGFVESSAERQKLEAAARDIAGYSAVRDETTVSTY